MAFWNRATKSHQWTFQKMSWKGLLVFFYFDLGQNVSISKKETLIKVPKMPKHWATNALTKKFVYIVLAASFIRINGIVNFNKKYWNRRYYNEVNHNNRMENQLLSYFIKLFFRLKYLLGVADSVKLFCSLVNKLDILNSF